jgi:hypothetical protein
MDETLLNKAKEYYELGLNIVPILRTESEKKPLVEWQKWNTERQTEEEFNALSWEKANSFAVVCGTQLRNGLFFCVIDQDIKGLSSEVIAKGNELIKRFPVTEMERTPSKGLHLVYYSREKPKTVSVFHNDYGLELLGEKKLCLMYPSEGYQRINDNTPTTVQDLTQIFYDALGVKAKAKKEAWFDRENLTEKPYRGETPFCIRQLEKGTKEGLRNEYSIRLAGYYANVKQFKPETCLKSLKAWNRLNEPGMEEREIEASLRSALQNGYKYGCNDPILKSLCNRESCILASKEEKVLTEIEKAKAEQLLTGSKLLDHVLAYGKKRLLGEDELLIQNFVSAVSGQTRFAISLVITGHSGSGKNESIRAVKPLIPEEWYFEFTVSTPEAIKYLPEDFDGTLLIYELEGIRSETGTLGLRSIGEAEGIKTIYPIRDEATGEMKLAEKQTKAKNFISTESGLDIAPDLYRRVFKNSMNDSTQLTKRVMGKKLRDSSLPESLRKKLFPEEDKEAYSESDFKNALRMLDLKAEVIIFPPYFLMDLINLATKKEQEVALRSQMERILNFIKILALIHQKQRIRFKDGENSYVIANPYDVETALRTLESSITETVSRIEKRQRQALDIITKSSETWNKNSLAEELHISSRTSASILKSLQLNGYLKVNEATRPFSYEKESEEKLPSTLAFSENASEYETFYEKELKSFLDKVLHTYTLEMPHFSLEGIETDHTEKDGIAEMQVCKMPIKNISKSVGETELNPFAESKKSKENEEIPTPALLQCSSCKEKGKKMFFASEQDLKLHTQVHHGCNPDYVR